MLYSFAALSVDGIIQMVTMLRMSQIRQMRCRNSFLRFAL